MNRLTVEGRGQSRSFSPQAVEGPPPIYGPIRAGTPFLGPFPDVLCNFSAQSAPALPSTLHTWARCRPPATRFPPLVGPCLILANCRKTYYWPVLLLLFNTSIHHAAATILPPWKPSTLQEYPPITINWPIYPR